MTKGKKVPAKKTTPSKKKVDAAAGSGGRKVRVRRNPPEDTYASEVTQPGTKRKVVVRRPVATQPVPVQTPVDFGALIHDLRKKRGWTQGQLADVAQVRPATISKVENGQTVTFPTVLKVVAALGMSLTVAPIVSKPFDPTVY